MAFPFAFGSRSVSPHPITSKSTQGRVTGPRRGAMGYEWPWSDEEVGRFGESMDAVAPPSCPTWKRREVGAISGGDEHAPALRYRRDHLPSGSKTAASLVG